MCRHQKNAGGGCTLITVMLEGLPKVLKGHMQPPRPLIVDHCVKSIGASFA